MAEIMAYLVFGSFVLGVVILYFAQKPESKNARMVLRIIGLFLLFWPLVQMMANVI